MSRALKVYGWMGLRRECPPTANGNQQTREICAATSKRDVARVAGVKGPHALWNLCVTGNDVECALALKSPGVIFWAPVNDAYRGEYRRAKPTKPAVKAT